MPPACAWPRTTMTALISAVLLVSTAAGASRAASGTTPADPSRALKQKLARTGRGEANLERVVPDPLSGKTRTVTGRLALEPPNRVEIAFPSTGERVALRGDSGAWLQPGLKQLLVLGPGRAAAAARWWRILMPGQSGLEARALGPSRFVVLARADASSPADSVWVWLDTRGLPSRLELDEGGETRTVYRFGGWRFRAAKGERAFTIDPPPGYEVVEVP